MKSNGRIDREIKAIEDFWETEPVSSPPTVESQITSAVYHTLRWARGYRETVPRDYLLTRREQLNRRALQIAESISRKAHTGQTEESTGDDYIQHVQRVVALVEGEEAKAVAWLHDVLEDSPWTASGLLSAGVPPRIVRAVEFLTRPESWEYADYIHRLKCSGDELAIAVKIADLKDHFRPNCPPSLRPRYERAWRTLAGELPIPGNPQLQREEQDGPGSKTSSQPKEDK